MKSYISQELEATHSPTPRVSLSDEVESIGYIQWRKSLGAELSVEIHVPVSVSSKSAGCISKWRWRCYSRVNTVAWVCLHPFAIVDRSHLMQPARLDLIDSTQGPGSMTF